MCAALTRAARLRAPGALSREETMNINWEDSSLRFDPNSPDPFATHGLPLPVYGNYGGPNWSAGQVGGTITPTSPPPVDDLDELFYQHDFVYQTSQDPLTRTLADIQLVEGMRDLTFTDPDGDPNYDPEAGLYEGFATLGILAQLAAGGVMLPDQDDIVQEAIVNFEAGLAAVPGEARSLHGAFQVFEHQYLDLLLV
jgi:hypothetical protein